MKKVIALQFCLLLLVSGLSGCLGFGEDETTKTSDTAEIQADWEVYSVQSVSDLPACNDGTDGRLYYIEAHSQFQTCAMNIWSIIDLTGPAGANGSTGAQGANGMNGSNGEQGLNGSDGADGMNGSNGQQGVNGSDGADGQDVNESYIVELEARIAVLEAEIVNLTSCKLVPWGNCARVNLDGMDLSGLDLTGINLEGASLIGTNFTNALLNQSSMAGIKAWNATFAYAHLNEADLSGGDFWKYEYSPSCDFCHATTDFYSTSMHEADLTDSVLKYVNLSFTFFRDADFSNSDMSYAQITDTYLVPAIMADVNLYSSNLSGTEIHDFDLSGANLVSSDLRSTAMYNVDLSGAFLFYSDLSTDPSTIHNSTYSNCDLSKARLDGTNLTGVIFYGNDLSFTSLSNAIVVDAFFGTPTNTVNTWLQTTWIDNIVYDHDPFWPCQLGPWASCAGVDLSGMDLSGMDLTGVDFRGANLTDANFTGATVTNAVFQSTIWSNTTWTDGVSYDSEQS